MRKFLRRLLIFGLVIGFLFFFVVVPLAGSYLITNSRFRFPERGPTRPEAVGLSVESVEFRTPDGVLLRGWWSPGDPEMPVVIFGHGLNRSRFEMLERGAEASRRGYGVLLFDFRNHGESGRAYTTLGVFESRDFCAARSFVERKARGRIHILWGVSMGASTAILSVRECPGVAAIVADSSFLSFSETVSHHFRLIFRLPSFPIANLIILLTSWRMGFALQDGDVEAAVRELKNTPILFIAGGADRRMPPEIARRLAAAATSPAKQLFLVDGAAHGRAFQTDREGYLKTVFGFLEKVPALR